MSQNFKLVINEVDLTNRFDRVVKLVGGIKLGADYDDNIEEAFIQLAVIKLRLCRWSATLMQLILAKDKTIPELDGHTLKMYLGNIEQILKSREGKVTERKSANRIHSEMVDSWLATTLDDLSLKHQGWSTTDSQASSSSVVMIESKEAFRRLRVPLVASMENLEQGGPQREFERLRQGDVATLKAHSESNEKDLLFLKLAAATVDPSFARYIQFGGHQFNRNVVDENGRGMLGDEISKDWSGLYQPPGSIYNDNIIKGHGQALLGNRLGQAGSYVGDGGKTPVKPETKQSKG
jgi:hypothetical protein